MKEQSRFSDLLNIDYLPVVRELLMELVPDEVKAEVIRRFNFKVREFESIMHPERDARGKS